jgi:aspartate aminotransferase
MSNAAEYFPEAAETDASLSELATGVIGSEILKIAADVRAARARGESLLDLTLGDFSPAEFPIPERLREEVARAYAENNTNYPPSDGVMALREAVAAHLAREQGLVYPIESILVAGGARPVLYGTYRTVLDPGDTVLYSVPSWNNNHYVHLTRVRAIEVEGRRENGFFPTVGELARHLPEARLVVVNSPLNPTGTVVDPDALAELSRLIVAENARRRRDGRKALFLLYDQVYSALHFGRAVRSSPPELVPEMFAYTLLTDGISKQFASTGLRVGWAVGPPALIRRMRDILGHVGAWAPKPEQVATARFLADSDAVAANRKQFNGRIQRRLELLFGIFDRLKADGFPVDSIEPQGAIYLSVRFDLPGSSNEEIRRRLLERARIAVVPFQAFGYRPENGWFRLSVGAASEEDIRAAEGRLRGLLEEVPPPVAATRSR